MGCQKRGLGDVVGAMAPRIVFVLILLGTLCAVVGRNFAETGERFPGQIPWGKSREEIHRSIEKAPDLVVSRGDVLAFSSKALGEDVVLEYTFRGDRLTEVRCVFVKYSGGRRERQDAETGQCIQDYLKIRKRLTKRLGEPLETGSATSREEAKALEVPSDVKDHRTLAFMEDVIRRGGALWYTSWKTEDTWTTLLLTGGKGAIRMEVRCSALRPKEGEDQRPLGSEYLER